MVNPFIVTVDAMGNFSFVLRYYEEDMYRLLVLISRRHSQALHPKSNLNPHIRKNNVITLQGC